MASDREALYQEAEKLADLLADNLSLTKHQRQEIADALGNFAYDNQILAAPPSAQDEKPHIQVDEALVRLGLTPTPERRDIMREILGLDPTGAPVHRNIHGQTFTDADLRNAGQDWGDPHGE